MNAERRRPLFLLLVSLLLAGWIGWLAYLAYSTTRPIVLARPQFLISQFDVITHVEATDGGPDPRVTVAEVIFDRDGAAAIKQGSKLEIGNLANLTRHEGWQGPGRYILPLIKEGEKRYRLAPIPRSPGYGGGPPRIYLVTPETLEQHRQIRAPEPHEPSMAGTILSIVTVVLLVFVVLMASVSIVVALIILIVMAAALLFAAPRKRGP